MTAGNGALAAAVELPERAAAAVTTNLGLDEADIVEIYVILGIWGGGRTAAGGFLVRGCELGGLLEEGAAFGGVEGDGGVEEAV